MAGALASFVSLIMGVRGQITQTILGLAQALIEALTPQIPVLGQKLLGLLSGLFDFALKQLVPQMAANTAALIEGLWAWVQKAAPPLLRELGNLASQIIAWVKGSVPRLIAAVREWTPPFIAWVAKTTQEMLPKVLELVSNIVAWLRKEGPPLLKTAVAEWAPALLAWVAEAAIRLAPELPKILFAITAWAVTQGIPGLLGLAADLAGALIEGLAQGIVRLAGELLGVLGRVLDDLTGGAVRAVADLPRRLAALAPQLLTAAGKLGDAISDGIVSGIKGAFGAVQDLGARLWQALKQVVNQGLRYINQMIPDKLGFDLAGRWVGIALPANPIPMLAAGTRAFAGGLAIVGERGPEPVILPTGAEVVPNGRARHLAGDTYSITINASYARAQSERRLYHDLRLAMMLAKGVRA